MGAVTCLEWTSDGYALAVGWERGWAIFTVGGRCICSSVSYEGERGRNAYVKLHMFGTLHANSFGDADGGYDIA